MKVNILARPDHSIALYKQLKEIDACTAEIKLFTFYCLRDGSTLSNLFPKFKRAPSDAYTLDAYTIITRLSNIILKKFGLNYRRNEIILMNLIAPWMRISDCDILHYWPFYCYDKVKELKNKRKIKTVAEYYEAEPDFVNNIYDNSLKLAGLPCNQHINLMIDQNSAFDFEENFIVGSEFTKRTYSKKYPKAKIHVCNYGPSGYRLIKEPKYNLCKLKKIKFIFVGQICIEKGVNTLLESAKRLNICVDLIGPIRDNQKNYFEKLISSTPNCTYHGPKRHSEVLKMLEFYDVFCLPSLADNYSLAVVEALSRGMPVIVTDNCGNADDVQKFNLGYVFKTSSVDGLNEVVEAIHTNFNSDHFVTGINEFFSDANFYSYPKSVLEVYTEIING